MYIIAIFEVSVFTNWNYMQFVRIIYWQWFNIFAVNFSNKILLKTDIVAKQAAV